MISKKIYRLRKLLCFYYEERVRIEKLKYFEKKYLSGGYQYIAGIDEAGRGALAGPVVAAAVILKDIDSFFLANLKDSKKLSKIKREYLNELIKNHSYDIAIGISDSEMIDKMNIRRATFLAMKRAIMNLKRFPDYILVDAFRIPSIKIPQQNLIKGEDKSITIAAASVIAKVYRDQIMNHFHERYPWYQFNQNVGYGTNHHIMTIKKYGICPLHRKTFKQVVDISDKKKEYIKQESLYKY